MDGHLASLVYVKNTLAECLEQPASDNGVDMHKYNMSYICKLDWHVLTPVSYDDLTLASYIAKNCRLTFRAMATVSFLIDRYSVAETL